MIKPFVCAFKYITYVIILMKSYTITNHCCILITLFFFKYTEQDTWLGQGGFPRPIRWALRTRSQSAQTNPQITDEYSHWRTNQKRHSIQLSLYYIGETWFIYNPPVLMSLLIYTLKSHFYHVHVQWIHVHVFKCDLKRGNCGYILTRSHPHRCITPIHLIRVPKKEKERRYTMET